MELSLVTRGLSLQLVSVVYVTAIILGLRVSDVDIYEINEAFASQAYYCVEELGIPMEKVNVNGGAIAIGHPLACTGARQIATLLHEMKRRGKRYSYPFLKSSQYRSACLETLNSNSKKK